VAPHRGTRGQRGQALAEMGMVVLLFTVITLGIVDFGRMLMILNVITHAARDGARAAAVIPRSEWSGGALSSGMQAIVQERVQSQLETVMTQGDAGGFTVTPLLVDAGAAGEEVSVTVSGTVEYLFGFSGIWGGDVTVDRVATFRFEG